MAFERANQQAKEMKAATSGVSVAREVYNRVQTNAVLQSIKKLAVAGTTYQSTDDDVLYIVNLIDCELENLRGIIARRQEDERLQ